jgi:hypothetical protein
MHCSIWTYEGDPGELVGRYEAMIADLPRENLRFTACARTSTGIVIFDTCPSKEVFDGFVASPDVRALLAHHRLDTPTSLVDYPIVAAYANGSRVDA